MLTGSERLDNKGRERMLLGLRVGDPNDEVLGAWLAKESVREIYLTRNRVEAEVLLDKVIAGCVEDDVSEIQSLGKTLAKWRDEILAYHDTRASNGPTEGLNLCVKKVKRCGQGFRWFEHYRLCGNPGYTPAASPGPTDPTHHESDPALLPTQTRRAHMMSEH